MAGDGVIPLDFEFDESEARYHNCPNEIVYATSDSWRGTPNYQFTTGLPKLEDNGGVSVEERLGLSPALLEKAEVTVYGTVKRVPSPDPGTSKMVCIGRTSTSTGWRLQVIETMPLDSLRRGLVDGFDVPSRGLGFIFEKEAVTASLLVEDRCRREDVHQRKERKKMQRIARKQEQRHKRDKYR